MTSLPYLLTNHGAFFVYHNGGGVGQKDLSTEGGGSVSPFFLKGGCSKTLVNSGGGVNKI
jgi:hypothetical protein